MKWQEPPVDRRDSGVAEIVAELRANRGRWALVRENTSASLMSRLKKFEGIEATSRGCGNGKFDVYARAIPQQVES